MQGIPASCEMANGVDACHDRLCYSFLSPPRFFFFLFLHILLSFPVSPLRSFASGLSNRTAADRWTTLIRQRTTDISRVICIIHCDVHYCGLNRMTSELKIPKMQDRSWQPEFQMPNNYGQRLET